ncbi:hypothetical protein Tco_0329188 [Tanacetum coccineum]
MPPRMRTQSDGRPVAESRGGGTGERVGRGGRVRGHMGGNDKRVDELNGQMNDQGVGANGGIKGVNRNVEGVNGAQVDNQGNVGSQNGNVVNENIQENVRNVLVNSNRADNAMYTDRFHELGMVAATEPKTMQKAMQISGALIDEAVRNGSIKKIEKRGNVGEPSKDKNGRDDNKRTRTRNASATTANPVGRENTGPWPKCTTYNSYHAPGGPCCTCFNCNRPSYFAKDCRVVPRNVNPINVRNPVPTRGACY